MKASSGEKNPFDQELAPKTSTDTLPQVARGLRLHEKYALQAANRKLHEEQQRKQVLMQRKEEQRYDASAIKRH